MHAPAQADSGAGGGTRRSGRSSVGARVSYVLLGDVMGGEVLAQRRAERWVLATEEVGMVASTSAGRGGGSDVSSSSCSGSCDEDEADGGGMCCAPLRAAMV